VKKLFLALVFVSFACVARGEDIVKPVVVSDVRSEIGAKESLAEISRERTQAVHAEKKAVVADEGYLTKELGGFEAKDPRGGKMPSTPAIMTRLAGALALIFVLMGTFAFVMKKFFAPQMGAKGGKMKIVETLLLAPNKQMYVIDVFGKRMVVASDAGGLKYFCDIDRTPEHDSFKSELQRQVKQYSVDEPEDLRKDISDIHTLTERLKRMKDGMGDRG